MSVIDFLRGTTFGGFAFNGESPALHLNFLKVVQTSSNFTVVANSVDGWLIHFNAGLFTGLVKYVGFFPVSTFVPGPSTLKTPPAGAVAAIVAYDDNGDAVAVFDALGGLNLQAGQFITSPNLLVSGADDFLGSAFADTLFAGLGDDLMQGADGNDVLHGEIGSDLLFGDAGNDNLFGEADNDVIEGGDGDDAIDGGVGTDLVSYFGSLAGVIVDLNIVGAQNTISAGMDTLVAMEDILGSGFDDILTGDAGANFIFGDAGTDVLDGRAGADALNGEAGDDALSGGGGADALDGGAGAADWADYSTSAAGVNVNLQNGAAAGGDAAGDTLTNIEYLRGSGLADTLTGNTLNNWLFGGFGADQIFGGDGADLLQGEGDADTLNGEGGIDSLAGGDGDDVLIGGAGADSLGGGAGIDAADYAASSAGANVNLQTGIATGGDAEGDTFVSIENVIGSVFADTLTGRDFVANTLTGGDGNDVLSGGTGGADVMIGGAGIDTLDYSLSPNGVDVRLFSGAAAGGSANGDSYSSIENIIGAATKTDTLAGDANANSIWGGGGNETITGRENTDTLYGEAGNDTLLGGADSDVLIGGIGADTLGGGSQDDTADYSASDAGVTVNLQTGSGLGGHAQGDVLVSIEDVIGSAFADVIIGKANVWDNVFDGRGGDDTYTGGLGDDVFVFRLNEGADIITDFVAGGTADAVQLAGFGASFDSFAEIIAAATQIGADTIIDFGAGQTLTLNNVALANLTSGDFIFGP
jgi:Ca2+-binding RTX toxin-like protein